MYIIIEIRHTYTVIPILHPYFDNGIAVNARQQTNISTTAGTRTEERALEGRLTLLRRTSFYKCRKQHAEHMYMVTA